MKRLIQMQPEDLVATALSDIQQNEIVWICSPQNEYLYEMRAKTSIPYGNKIALRDISAEEDVIKYGCSIGICTKAIQKGTLVHVHNVKSRKIDIPEGIRREIIRQMNIQEEAYHDEF